ncbi:cytochrome P450 [Hypoxylon sp. FL1284]|nr:cytochrome P450 [Hypoxylon sp. FL1284]
MAPAIPETGSVRLALVGVTLLTAYIVGIAVYRLFLHPLRSYPGPILWRISVIPRAYYMWRGLLTFKSIEFFNQYGSVVRTGPDELLYNHPDAWKDIYGHRSGGAPELAKHPTYYNAFPGLPRQIINADREEHQLLRRQLSHGFSDKMMREQEPIIGSYVDLLIQRVHENCLNGAAALDMRNWYTFTSFDVIGDLGFGSAFGSLQDSKCHPWVKIVTSSIIEVTMFQTLLVLGLRPAINLARRWGLLPVRDQNLALAREKLEQRVKLGASRPDFMEGLINKKGEWNMSMDHLLVNAELLISAGSETTSSLLAGATYLLATNPEHLAKLTQEVRSSFKSDSEITLTSVGDLRYMLAVLDESLRRYPPASGDLPRLVPKGGVTILGKHVAEGTAVQIYQYPINHDKRWWKNPWKFAPERWLGDPEYKGDRREAMQPFSYGPRNCIGKNLAYAEMRLILAKIIFNFDMTLCDDSKDWLNQRAYGIWDKPALNLYMKPVGTTKAG